MVRGLSSLSKFLLIICQQWTVYFLKSILSTPTLLCQLLYFEISGTYTHMHFIGYYKKIAIFVVILLDWSHKTMLAYKDRESVNSIW